MIIKFKKRLSKFYLAHFDKFLKHKFDFAFIDYKDIDNYKYSLTDIYYEKTDGLVISNFINSKEIELILERLKKNKQHLNHIQFGTFYGNTLSDSTDDAYFDLAKELNPDVKKLLGDGVFDRLVGVFNKIEGKDNVEIAKNLKDDEFVCISARFLKPGKGGLPIHTEIAATTDIDPLSEEVNKVFNRENIISFFFNLENSEKGGNMILFNDTQWEPGVGLKTVSQLLFKSGQKIKPKPGELLIFNGGHIWHKVEDIKGKSDRITVGGFMDMSADKTKWLFWT